MIIRLSSVVALLLAFHLLVPAVAAPAAPSDLSTSTTGLWALRDRR